MTIYGVLVSDLESSYYEEPLYFDRDKAIKAAEREVKRQQQWVEKMQNFVDSKDYHELDMDYKDFVKTGDGEWEGGFMNMKWVRVVKIEVE